MENTNEGVLPLVKLPANMGVFHIFFRLYKWYQIVQSVTYVVRCAIWYYLYNLKNVKNTHGGVLILVKLQACKLATLLKLTLLHGYFSRFLTCTNSTKLRNASHIFSYMHCKSINRFLYDKKIGLKGLKL